VEVNVEVQRRAETLNQGDRARAGPLLRVSGLPDQVRGNDSVDDAKYPAAELGMRGQQKPQWERKAEHPLPDRVLGQHPVDQPGRAIGHAPGATTRAKAAALAAERQQMFGVVGVASKAQEAMLQPTAL